MADVSQLVVGVVGWVQGVPSGGNALISGILIAANQPEEGDPP